MKKMLADQINRYERRKQLKTKLIERGIPALLIIGKENRLYLSGFHSSDCAVIITETKDYLLTDFRYEQAAREICPDFELILISKNKQLPDAIKSLGITQLGIEFKTINVALYNMLANVLGGPERIANGDGLVEGLRMIKDEKELSDIAEAEALGDKCFEHILSKLCPGITEKQIALEIEFFLRENGASSLSFETICVSGERSALPHGMPSDKPFEKGDFITLDYGCILNDYCSDMTRTVAIGPISDFQKEVYQIVLNAQLAGCSALRSGLPCSEGDLSARRIIEDAGFGEYFGHGLGHGVGLAIHEAPTLNTTSEEVLAKNMVITIEPGIYIPGQFGIRIEDLAFVTDFGIIIKSQSPKELIIL